MPAAARWIIGRGLLGSAVSSTRDDPPFTAPIRWTDPTGSRADLRRGLTEFLSSTADAFEIYWCAGKGVTSTPRDALEREAEVFEVFLGDLIDATRTRAAPLRVFLASSVGGAYGGSGATPFTEHTPASPSSPYGEAKLRMEAALTSAAAASGFSAFIARITNLYGPGQDLGKGQGLISVMVESYVTGRPVSIYVPLDTLRDYIFVDDCALVIDAGMRRLAGCEPGTTVLKIVGAMNALSVGAIVGEMRRLRRKPVPIVLGQGNSTGQASDLRVKSVVWPDLDGLVATTIPEGLGAIYRAQLQSHMLPRS